ncbi:MAG: ribonuclease D, partial [Anaerolineales bacterium]|nr:ribonuclease D [Anaerolineales bacterium]
MTGRTNQLNPPQFINKQSDFEALARRLKAENILAVDTEANSLYAYEEKVCLIQISTEKDDYIIDPLPIRNLTPLGEIFNDPSIEKIFHASEYDIIILHNAYQFNFQNLFDTMLAAQILGRDKLGLDALMEEIVGIHVNKKYQRANWGKRPLSEEMLQYAQMDTHHLILIRHTLAAELEKKNLTPIAEEDFIRACQAHLQTKEE